MHRYWLIGLLLLVLLAACSSNQTPTVTVSPRAEDEHMEEGEHIDDETHEGAEAVEQGLDLFRSMGCAGCHGQDGQGDTGPALAGHTLEQVRRQVRTPTGDVMPAFSEEQLSDEQLELIAIWIQSLGPATGDHHHDEQEHMHTDEEEHIDEEEHMHTDEEEHIDEEGHMHTDEEGHMHGDE